MLSHHPIFRLLIYHQVRILILTQIFQFFYSITYNNHIIICSHDRSYNNSPDTPQISQELDNFITLQQQLIHPSTLTIHQLSSTITSSNPPTRTPPSAYTPSLAQSSTSTETPTSTHRAYRSFKRKFPNHSFPTKPGTAREYINHLQHTNTKNFLEITLPSFPQYPLNTPNDTNDTRIFVDEHVLMPTLHWIAYYNFTNPLCLPLTNNHDSIEKNKNLLYRLTTTLTPRQFTYVDYKKLLKTFTAPRANEFAIEYYDHNIIRPNQDQFLDENRFANPQLTENVFIKTSYVFTLNIFDRKNEHVISESLADIQAYESFYDKFQLFSLFFNFLSPQERNLHCSHDIMLRTKQTLHIHTIVLYKIILICTPHQDNFTIVFRFLFQSTRHHFSLILHIESKILTSTASAATMTQLPKCIYSVPSRRPSMPKNPDLSLSRMNLSRLLKYPC